MEGTKRRYGFQKEAVGNSTKSLKTLNDFLELDKRPAGELLRFGRGGFRKSFCE
jgi:hypothetical protein